MNKIEQMHFEAITEAEFSNYTGHYQGQEKAALKSAEITSRIAVYFGKWLYTTECLDLIHDMKLVGEDTSIENLFQEFLKTKQ